jgi:hypothetical protein
MKFTIQSQAISFAVASAVLLLTLIKIASAQENSGIVLVADQGPLALKAHNVKTDRQVFFAVGQSAKYQARPSRKYETGLITDITDSTVSFESRKTGHVTIRQDSLKAFKIRRSWGRNAVGAVLIGGGLMALFATTVSLTFPFIATPASFYAGFGGSGVGLCALGLGIQSQKKLDFENSWALQPSKAVLPGNVLTLIMKNGEAVKLRVTHVGADDIVGRQIGPDGKSGMKRHMNITDIFECSRVAI